MKDILIIEEKFLNLYGQTYDLRIVTVTSITTNLFSFQFYQLHV
jgi:hypothetical protein